MPTKERFDFGCFAVDGCPALQETVVRSIAAWTNRDPDAIGAFYADEVLFVDSLLGLRATGPETVGDLANERCGSAGELSMRS